MARHRDEKIRDNLVVMGILLLVGVILVAALVVVRLARG